MNEEIRHEVNLMQGISRLDQAITNRCNEILRSSGVARKQWEVMKEIDRNGSVTQRDLQKAMGVESGTVTGIVEALVKKGFVNRQEHAKDRRVNMLSLTDDGSNLSMFADDPFTLVPEQMMKGVSADHEKIFVQVIAQVLANIESYVSKPKRLEL